MKRLRLALAGQPSATPAGVRGGLRAALCALVASVGLLWAPMGAQADVPAGTHWAQQMAAEQFPPTCPITVSMSTVPNQEDADAYADGAGCQVLLSPTTAWTPWKLCVLVTHEYGHLAGLAHSTDPNSVMYPTPSYAPRCSRFFARMSDTKSSINDGRRILRRDRYRASRKRWAHHLAVLRHELAVMRAQVAD